MQLSQNSLYQSCGFWIFYYKNSLLSHSLKSHSKIGKKSIIITQRDKPEINIYRHCREQGSVPPLLSASQPGRNAGVGWQNRQSSSHGGHAAEAITCTWGMRPWGWDPSPTESHPPKPHPSISHKWGGRNTGTGLIRPEISSHLVREILTLQGIEGKLLI